MALGKRRTSGVGPTVSDFIGADAPPGAATRKTEREAKVAVRAVALDVEKRTPKTATKKKTSKKTMKSKKSEQATKSKRRMGISRSTQNVLRSWPALDL